MAQTSVHHVVALLRAGLTDPPGWPRTPALASFSSLSVSLPLHPSSFCLPRELLLVQWDPDQKTPLQRCGLCLLSGHLCFSPLSGLHSASSLPPPGVCPHAYKHDFQQAWLPSPTDPGVREIFDFSSIPGTEGHALEGARCSVALLSKRWNEHRRPTVSGPRQRDPQDPQDPQGRLPPWTLGKVPSSGTQLSPGR